MMPKWHVLYSFVLTYLLVYFFHISFLSASLIFLSAIFIDLDHYFSFILKQKKFHPKKFWNWTIQRKKEWEKIEDKNLYKYPLFVFHGFECLAILAILSFLNLFFFWIFIGFAFHIFLDLLHLLYREEKLHKISQIHTFKTNKNKRQF